MTELYAFCGTNVFGHLVAQYCTLQGETACTRKNAGATFGCVRNKLETRSGSLCGEKSMFGKFSGRQPKITHVKDTLAPKVRTELGNYEHHK